MWSPNIALRRRVQWCAALIWSLFALFSQATADPPPRSVTLSWAANTEADIAGYKLHYGTASGLYNQAADVGNTTSATISNLANDTAYFFVITAYNIIGLESAPSNEINIPPNTPQEIWRQQYFGTTANAGNAADSATPQNDGLTNLMKFATGMDPTVPGTMPGALARSGNNLTFTYTRSKAAVSAGLLFTVEWSDTLGAGSWNSTGVSESSVDQGATEMVTATLPAGASGRRFVHLVVTSP